MTFTFRDARKVRLDAALAALTRDPGNLRPVLESELTALGDDTWQQDDRTHLAVAEDWLWSAAVSLIDLVNTDPVFAALGTTASITAAQAAAVAALSPTAGGFSSTYLASVEDVVDGDGTAFHEIVDAAHHAWITTPPEDRSYPFDDVGVMLPLRLETLFDAPGTDGNPSATQWRLSLRAIPDEASILRDDAFVSPGEIAVLSTFWRSVRQGGVPSETWLDGDAAAAAWQLLCNRIAAPRAAWLIGHVVPEVTGGVMTVAAPADMPTVPEPNRVAGLPPALAVWASTRDGAGTLKRHAVGRLPMDPTASIDHDALSLPLPTSADETRDAWWSSFATAKSVGLGGEWALEDGLSPDTLDAIWVVGIGDSGPAAHFNALSDSGELAVIPLGTPTNSIGGAESADLGTDAPDWRAIARARLAERIRPGSTASGNAGQNIEVSLTGAISSIPTYPGADAADDTQDSQRMAEALWPALAGQWLNEIWGNARGGVAVARWAFPPRSTEAPELDELESIFERTRQRGQNRRLRHNLAPEGPLMPIRIAEQPYGLLPVTALSRWDAGTATTKLVPGTPADAVQRDTEREMAKSLSSLVEVWAAAARGGGNVIGATSAEFTQFLGRDAATKTYARRAWAPSSAFVAPYSMLPAQLSEFLDVARELWRPASNVMRADVPQPHLTTGKPSNSELALVAPSRWLWKNTRQQDQSDAERVSFLHFLDRLFSDRNNASPAVPLDLADMFTRVYAWETDSEYRLHVLPDSLLMRLMTYVVRIAASRRDGNDTDKTELPSMLGQLRAISELAVELDTPTWATEDRDTTPPLFGLAIPDARRAQLERALRATLDSAQHRIDPWVTGFAWQRLKVNSTSPRHEHRLGAYGWVEGPFLGTPGPTDSGRIHTPSYNQTLAGIILRDRFQSSARSATVGDSGQNPWEMNLSSRKTRLAEEISDEVRLGFHIYEVIGRRVEHIVGTHEGVSKLRESLKYAMRPERQSPDEVCNGMVALDGIRTGTDPDFPLSATQLADLAALHAALDGYSDLLMADGVMQLISRQTDRAADSMDAAAGLGRPPTFEFIRTPPSGYHLETLALSAVPYVAKTGAKAGPTRIADPSIAAFAEKTIGSNWTWKAIDADSGATLGSVTLAELKLTPIDTLGLSTDFLSELARHFLGLPLVFLAEGHTREWTVRRKTGARLRVVSVVDLRLLPAELAALTPPELDALVRAKIGAPASSTIEETTPTDARLWTATDENGELLGMTSITSLGAKAAGIDALSDAARDKRLRAAMKLPNVLIESPSQQQLLLHLVVALGSRPAAARDVVLAESEQPQANASVYQELCDRYGALFTSGTTLAAALASPVTSAVRRVGLLRRVLAWGITPIAQPADREALFAALTGHPAPSGSTSLADLCAAAGTALQSRLDAAPSPPSLLPPSTVTSPTENHEQRAAGAPPDGVASVAQEIAALAAPNAKLAILACWSRSVLAAQTSLSVTAAETAIDDTWLTVVAAVRPPLSRLEAVQLELSSPMPAWSSCPGDPWRKEKNHAIAKNLAARASGTALAVDTGDRLVVAYGSAAAWKGTKVAVGLVDSFSEAIPLPQRSTSAAIGFNAPSARAPQAILLAVPPTIRTRLDEEVLLDVITETRELAQARTTRLQDLGDMRSLVPTMWMSGSGPLRVRLEPVPLFP